MSFDSPETRFLVVINAEQQYAIWPDYKPVPAGWQDVGVHGDRQTCLAHIAEVWTDMRPRSLREAAQA
jgi:MbtH protein